MKIKGINDIIVRTANNKDQEKIIALVFSVLTEYGLPPSPDSKDSDLLNIEQNYLQSGGIFEIIQDKQGNLLGTYGLFPLNEEQCELRKMYFVPQIRGIGLGRQILERAVGQAKRLGFKAIVLETISVLEEAVRLYTRFGFKSIETKNISDRVDQAYMLKLDNKT